MKYIKTFPALLESKKTEEEGLRILNSTNIENSNQIINKFKEIDSSNNQKNIPYMCVLYTNGATNIQQIKSTFDDYENLLKRNLIKPIQIVKNADKTFLKIADKTFDNFIKFTEYIHGKKPAQISTIKKGDVISDNKEKPIWSGNNIFIYSADSVDKAIRFTQGGLTGKSYAFCIGQYGNSMYNSYRDTKASSFYFIIDKNRELSDPLHIVVYDATQYGVELTDANNNTGNIAEYGTNVEKYQEYLEGKGVPYEKLLVNRPKTEEEIKEEKLLGNKNYDLDWFIALPVEYKSKYVGRGHLLTNEQFDYLLEN